MSSYILLVIAWIFLLVVNIILWVNNGSPNIVALGFFAVLSIVPVVDWLKIGSWFEFGKKGRHVKDEAAARDERIIIEKWNNQADENNKWETLSDDEQWEWTEKCENS